MWIHGDGWPEPLHSGFLLHVRLWQCQVHEVPLCQVSEYLQLVYHSSQETCWSDGTDSAMQTVLIALVVSFISLLRKMLNQYKMLPSRILFLNWNNQILIQ